MSTKKIVIFLCHIPFSTQTFIVNELKLIKRSGFDYIVFYEEKNRLSERHKFAIKYSKLFHYVPRLPQNKIKKIKFIIKNQRNIFLTFPIQYLKVLFWILFHYKRIYLRNFFRLSEIIHQIIKYNPDLFYSHHSHDSAVLAFLASKLISKKYGFISHQIKLYPETCMPHHRLASFIIVKAKFVKENYLYNCKELDSNKIIVLPWGIDNKFFKKKDGKQKDRFNILSISRLEEKKGLYYLLQACKILNDKKINCYCRIIGDGLERKRLINYIKKNKLRLKVKIDRTIPHSMQFKKILNSADVFILPSIIDRKGELDIIPNVLLEAMAMELPVITTKVNGMTEIVEDGYNGFVIEEKNEIDLANKIIKVMSLSNYAKKIIGYRARKVVLEKLDREKQGKKLITFLGSIC